MRAEKENRYGRTQRFPFSALSGLFSIHFPNDNCRIVRSGGDIATIGGPGDIDDGLAVTLVLAEDQFLHRETPFLLAVRSVLPDVNAAAAAIAASDIAAVGRPGDAVGVRDPFDGIGCFGWWWRQWEGIVDTELERGLVGFADIIDRHNINV